MSYGPNVLYTNSYNYVIVVLLSDDSFIPFMFDTFPQYYD